MLLTTLQPVLVLQYLFNLSLMAISSLLMGLDRSFVKYLLESAIDQCLHIHFATWESNTYTVDFDLPQTFSIPLKLQTGCHSSRLLYVDHLLKHMWGYYSLDCLFPSPSLGYRCDTSCTQLLHCHQLYLQGPKHIWYVIYGGCLELQVDGGRFI